MKCSQCGQELRDDAQFCSNCGHSVEMPETEPSKMNKEEKSAYVLSIAALLIVVAMMAYGCYMIISRDMQKTGAVSASDEAVNSFNYDAVHTDPELIGKWVCKDRAAADYGDNNFGVEVKILLTMNAEGGFVLDYTMYDTGVPAKTLNITGTYTTDKGTVTFVPDTTDGAEAFLKKHGSHPSFPYTTEENTFTLTYKNKKKIVFDKVKEKEKK